MCSTPQRRPAQTKRAPSAVLVADAPGRRADDEITTFDSTGLAIQDLAIALAALERRDELDLPTIDL
jgi:alanine dehydrogenase